MKPQVMGLRVASIVFGLMMLAQLARLLLRPEVMVQGHLMPLWPSILAAVFLGVLCAWLWRVSMLRPQEGTNQKHG